MSALPKRPELPPGWWISSDRYAGCELWDALPTSAEPGSGTGFASRAEAVEHAWSGGPSEWVEYANAMEAEVAQLRARLDKIRDGLHACEDAKDLYDLAYEAILGYEKEPTP